MGINSKKDLAEALDRGDDTIVIEGDLKNSVIRIRATGAVAWLVAIGAIGIAVVATIAAIPTGGTSELAAFAMAPAAIAVLGGSTTIAAIAIAVSAGGVGALTKLMAYKEVSRTADQLVLRRA